MEQKQTQMSDKEYIEALENALIFMCDWHERVNQSLFEECRKRQDAQLLGVLPTIQGTPNVIAVSQIAEVGFERAPRQGFPDIYRELVRRRGDKR